MGGANGTGAGAVQMSGGMMELEKVEQKPAATLAKREPMEFVPRNVDQAWRMAELLAKASIVPDTLKGKPHDLLVVLMTGAELGLSPVASMREIYVVKGKGYISALLKVALVRQSPECLKWRLVESSAERATFETQRRGDDAPTRLTFTKAEAAQAGLVGDNWNKYGPLMLRRRCSSQLTDEVYPDVTRGLGIIEEMQEVYPSEVTITRIDHEQVSAPPPPTEQLKASAAPAEPAKTDQPAAEAKPGEVDPVAIALAQLEGADHEDDIDAIVTKLQTLVPKGDPRRNAVGDAINKAKRRVRSA